MPTLTVQPARCNPRNTSAALYAAMPPLIPSATFFSVKKLSKGSLAPKLTYLKLKINVTLPKQARNGRFEDA
jgi:hypothetical protein